MALTPVVRCVLVTGSARYDPDRYLLFAPNRYWFSFKGRYFRNRCLLPNLTPIPRLAREVALLQPHLLDTSCRLRGSRFLSRPSHDRLTGHPLVGFSGSGLRIDLVKQVVRAGPPEGVPKEHSQDACQSTLIRHRSRTIIPFSLWAFDLRSEIIRSSLSLSCNSISNLPADWSVLHRLCALLQTRLRTLDHPE